MLISVISKGFNSRDQGPIRKMITPLLSRKILLMSEKFLVMIDLNLKNWLIP
jgi:hypothetical protein